MQNPTKTNQVNPDLHKMGLYRPGNCIFGHRFCSKNATKLRFHVSILENKYRKPFLKKTFGWLPASIL